MVVRRSSTVAAQARAAARDRRLEVLAKRREREQRISGLADAHAVALAIAKENLTEADKAVVELLELGERPDAVAELLGVSVAEVRAARRRRQGHGSDTDGGSGGPREDGGDAAEPVQDQRVGEGEPVGA